MKKLFLISAAASLLATAAFGQATVTTTTGTAGAAVQMNRSITPRSKAMSLSTRSAPSPRREKIVVGGRVPADVELVSVPLTGVRLSPSIAKCIRVTASCWSIRGSRTVVQEVD